ncbi:hypothetical protein QBE55_02655 [Eubacteriales bacterium mix99]|jgi:hypothetical protein|nr:hypothetical protein [Clostridiales bacterium]
MKSGQKFFEKFKGKLMSGFLTSYLILILIPIMIGCGAYIIIENNIEKEAIRIKNTIIEQIGETVDQDISIVNNICEQLTSNTKVKNYSTLSDQTNRHNYFELREIAYDIKNATLLSNDIEGIFVYFPKSNTIIFKEGIYDPYSFFRYNYYIKDYTYEKFCNQILNQSHSFHLLDVSVGSRKKIQKN